MRSIRHHGSLSGEDIMRPLIGVTIDVDGIRSMNFQAGCDRTSLRIFAVVLELVKSRTDLGSVVFAAPAETGAVDLRKNFFSVCG